MWALGCANSPNEAVITQPRAHLLADRCIVGETILIVPRCPFHFAILLLLLLNEKVQFSSDEWAKEKSGGRRDFSHARPRVIPRSPRKRERERSAAENVRKIYVNLGPVMMSPYFCPPSSLTNQLFPLCLPCMRRFVLDCLWPRPATIV